MRRILIVTVILSCLLMITPTFAQEPGWQVNLFETSSGRILNVTDQGVSTRFTLPDIASFGVINQIMISPDNRYVVFASINGGESGIFLGDIQAGTCCTELPDVIPTGADFAFLGSFSPDGTQISAALSNVNVADASESRAGFVVTYDLATAAVTNFVSLAMFGEDTDILLGAYVGVWYRSGIEVFATCMACDRPTSGINALWNPVENTITPNYSLFENAGKRMLASGEMVLPARDEAYPIEEGLLGNVIYYYPNVAPQQTPSVIYSNPDYLFILDVNWIRNGENLLVTHVGADVSVVVDRTGAQNVLEIPSQNQFVAPTPDGWLARNETQLIRYTLQDDTLTETTLGDVAGGLIRLDTVILPVADTTPFPAQ